ncbi:MAG: response regulator [Acetobacterales bacterium]
MSDDQQQNQSVETADLRILIIDHSQEMRQLIRDMLARMGIRRVSEARGVEPAQEIIQENRIHVVLVDWDLEPNTGLDVVKLLRDRDKSPNPFVPIIMLTGIADKDRVLQSRDAGVNEFLLKPLSSKMLYDRIHAAANAARPFVEAKQYFGPDRRRKTPAGYQGPKRRTGD